MMPKIMNRLIDLSTISIISKIIEITITFYFVISDGNNGGMNTQFNIQLAKYSNKGIISKKQ